MDNVMLPFVRGLRLSRLTRLQGSTSSISKTFERIYHEDNGGGGRKIAMRQPGQAM